MIGAWGGDRYAALVSAWPVLRNAKCDSADGATPEPYLAHEVMDEKFGDRTNGGSFWVCRGARVSDPTIINIDHPDFTSTVRYSVAGSAFIISLKTPDPVAAAERLRKDGYRYAVILRSRTGSYYNVPW